MKLYYVFDSDYVEKGYESYEGKEFAYEVDDSDVKYYIADYYTGAHGDADTTVDVLDQLEYDGLLNWDDVMDSFYDTLRERHIADAMQWYAENHLTKIEEEEE